MPTDEQEGPRGQEGKSPARRGNCSLDGRGLQTCWGQGRAVGLTPRATGSRGRRPQSSARGVPPPPPGHSWLRCPPRLALSSMSLPSLVAASAPIPRSPAPQLAELEPRPPRLTPSSLPCGPLTPPRPAVLAGIPRARGAGPTPSGQTAELPRGPLSSLCPGKAGRAEAPGSSGGDGLQARSDTG